MTAIAPHMTAYLRQRLMPMERAASQHTCDTCACTFQILLDFASHKLAVPPSALQLEHLDAPLVLELSGAPCRAPVATRHAPATLG